VIVLGIESSCDETGVALVKMGHDARPVLLGQTLHSQVDMHRAYGGVVPELASRDHTQRIVPLVREALEQSGLSTTGIDVVAYTKGPGLAGALLVGAGVACAMGMALGRPVLGVHHLEGHLLSPFLASTPPTFPFVCLLVSGGHTQLMHCEGIGRYTLLGETIDDAAGEAFDKCAKLLGLGYPGGPALAALASQGNAQAHKLPRPLLHEPRLNFSFAGLKTAVMTTWRRLGTSPSEGQRADLAASTQAAIVDVLVAKTLRALQQCQAHQLVVAGGVGANQRLRENLREACAARGVDVAFPPVHLCTDNGAMIATAAALRMHAGVEHPVPARAFDVRPRWPLAEGRVPQVLS
jgi:N6-L-threonylcarbamoyladenine synthase